MDDHFLSEWFQSRRVCYRNERYDEFVAETWLAVTCNLLVVAPYASDRIFGENEFESAATVCDIADMLSDLSSPLDI